MVNAVDTQKGGKKRHVSLIPGWNLSQQSSLFAHPVSHSLSLSRIHPRAILKSSTCSTGRGGGGEEGWRVHGITTTMRARRTVYNSVATSCADTRHSTMVQRMDPRAGYSIFGKCASEVLSYRIEEEKDLR